MRIILSSINATPLALGGVSEIDSHHVVGQS